MGKQDLPAIAHHRLPAGSQRALSGNGLFAPWFATIKRLGRVRSREFPSSPVSPLGFIDAIPDKSNHVNRPEQLAVMAKRVQVVLNETVRKLGRTGDLVDVAPGYARNYLYPQGLAVPASAGVLKQVEYRRAKETERLAALKGEADALKESLEAVETFVVRKQSGEKDVIFGKVTNGDIAEAIQAIAGRTVDRRDIEVPEIKKLGTYEVQVYLHPEVTAVLQVQVAAL